MAAKLILEDKTTLPDGNNAIVRLEVKDYGCDVQMPSTGRFMLLTWSQMNDPETVAELFENETVKTLRVIVGLLEKLYINRHLYQALL